ncbi:MAG: AAA family ATPase, partial [Planctomycetota bacterium]
KVLLMDEPASGLDPRARIEIRELLKELKRMGKTILISSHILHELAELCNVVGIIEKGQLLFSGPVDEILRRARVGHVLHIGVADRVKEAAQLVAKAPGVKKVSLARPETPDAQPLIHVTYDTPENGAGVGGVGASHSFTDLPPILLNNGFRITQFSEEPVNLETAFMRLTKGLVQ